MEDECLEMMAEPCPQVKVLNVSGCRRVTDVGLRAAAQRFSQLEQINLSGCSGVTDATLVGGWRKTAHSCGG